MRSLETVNQIELSVSQKEASTTAEEGEEPRFSSQRTVMQLPLRKGVSVIDLVWSSLSCNMQLMLKNTLLCLSSVSTVSSKPVVSLHPNWPLIFSGEAITIKCRIYEDTITEWEYEWSKPNSNTSPADDEHRISNATVSNSGNYKCVGKHKWDTYSLSEWSDVVTLIVSCKFHIYFNL